MFPEKPCRPVLVVQPTISVLRHSSNLRTHPRLDLNFRVETRIRAGGQGLGFRV